MSRRYLKAELIATQISSSGDNTILSAPGAGREYVLASLQIQNASSSDTTALVKSGATTKLAVVMPSKGDGLVKELEPCWRYGDNAAVVVNLSGANAVWVQATYWIEPTLV